MKKSVFSRDNGKAFPEQKRNFDLDTISSASASEARILVKIQHIFSELAEILCICTFLRRLPYHG